MHPRRRLSLTGGFSFTCFRLLRQVSTKKCTSHTLGNAEGAKVTALTSAPGLMSVFTGLHSKTVATEGGVDGRSMRPASDSTARNALTSEALQDPLIPEHHGQKTCRVGLAGIHPASRPGFYGIRTEREKNGIKDVILRISFRHRLSLY